MLEIHLNISWIVIDQCLFLIILDHKNICTRKINVFDNYKDKINGIFMIDKLCPLWFALTIGGGYKQME
jgi:hypothetical protein